MPGFTGHIEDTATGLTYMQARYYDPILARFLSSEPVQFSVARPEMFGRYTYAANDPVNMWDPDGEQAVSPQAFIGRQFIGRGLGKMNHSLAGARPEVTVNPPFVPTVGAEGALVEEVFDQILNEDASAGTSGSSNGENSNPYDGPVKDGVIVVDGNGNAIPVEPGEQITGSPNGDYQQVRDSKGKPTGVRLDKGGHKNQSDPSAQGPHGHRPGVTRPDGNPHLPIRDDAGQ